MSGKVKESVNSASVSSDSTTGSATWLFAESEKSKLSKLSSAWWWGGSVRSCGDWGGPGWIFGEDWLGVGREDLALVGEDPDAGGREELALVVEDPDAGVGDAVVGVLRGILEELKLPSIWPSFLSRFSRAEATLASTSCRVDEFLENWARIWHEQSKFKERCEEELEGEEVGGKYLSLREFFLFSSNSLIFCEKMEIVCSRSFNLVWRSTTFVRTKPSSILRDSISACSGLKLETFCVTPGFLVWEGREGCWGVGCWWGRDCC